MICQRFLISLCFETMMNVQVVMCQEFRLPSKFPQCFRDKVTQDKGWRPVSDK